METLLITGGAGFIGSNFVRHILKHYDDYRVINLDKLTYAGNLENLRDIENDDRYTFVKGDICDENIVGNCLEQAESLKAVINFAADTHVDRSIAGAGSFIQTDVMGVYVLLEQLLKYRNDAIFFQISTDEVYGSIEEGSFRESDPLKPNSPYSASKAGAEMLVRAYQITYGVKTLVARSSNNFGPYQYPEKLIPLFITNALQNKEVPLYGDGLNVRDWLYVEDNCKGIDFILHNGEPGETYNVGGGNEETNITITKTILNLLGKDESLIKYVKDRPGHDRRYSIDCSKLQAIGWAPEKNFVEAMNETVNWYRDRREWWENIKNKREEYKRFYQSWYSSLEKGE